MTKTNLLAAILGGAAVGAALGILYAPHSGSDTRKKMRQFGAKSTDYLDDLIEQGKKTWYESKGKVETEAGIAADEVDDLLRHMLKNGEQWWNNTKNRASDIAKNAENTLEEATHAGRRTANRVTQQG